MLFMLYQMTFAVITVALVAGSVVDRMRFSAFVWFTALWPLFVYAPIAHWVWGGGFLTPAADRPGVLDFAGGTVVHLNASMAGRGTIGCFRRKQIPAIQSMGGHRLWSLTRAS
jgi:ammonium transporter, Amt family